MVFSGRTGSADAPAERTSGRPTVWLDSRRAAARTAECPAGESAGRPSDRTVSQPARPAGCPVHSSNPHMCTNSNPSPKPNGNLMPAITVTTTLTLTRNPHFSSLHSSDGSLRSTRGPAPAPPLNNKTPVVATDRLVSVLPCVCTTLCVDHQTDPCFGSLHSMQGPAPAPSLNNKTPAVATDRLVCAPPCVCTTLCMHHLVCGPPNHPFARPLTQSLFSTILYVKVLFVCRGRGLFLGGVNGMNRTVGRPAGRALVYRRAGTSAEPLSGIFCQAETPRCAMGLKLMPQAAFVFRNCCTRRKALSRENQDHRGKNVVSTKIAQNFAAMIFVLPEFHVKIVTPALKLIQELGKQICPVCVCPVCKRCMLHVCPVCAPYALCPCHIPFEAGHEECKRRQLHIGSQPAGKGDVAWFRLDSTRGGRGGGGRVEARSGMVSSRGSRKMSRAGEQEGDEHDVRRTWECQDQHTVFVLALSKGATDSTQPPM